MTKGHELLKQLVKEEMAKAKQNLSFKRINEVSNDIVKRIRVPNVDYVNSLFITKSQGNEGKFCANPVDGLSVSILDLINRKKEFNTPEEAEKYAMQIVKIWTKLLDSYYRK